MGVAVNGVKTIRATADAVWAALADVDRLALCIPGCRSLVAVSPTLFALKVGVKVGPVQLECAGTVERVVELAPRILTLVGRGEGNFARFAVGSARIVLADVPGGCRVDYRIVSDMGGPLASFGAFGLAKGLSEAFLASLADLVRVEARTRPARLAGQAGASP